MSGPFRIEQAISLDQLDACIAAGSPLPMLSPLQALAHLPTVTVDQAGAHVLACGQRMEWSAFTNGRDLMGPVCAVRAGAGEPVLVAVVEANSDGTVKILRGFRQA